MEFHWDSRTTHLMRDEKTFYRILSKGYLVVECTPLTAVTDGNSHDLDGAPGTLRIGGLTRT